LARSVSIAFVGLPPASGEWVQPYTWVYADGISWVYVTILLRDTNGNPVVDSADVTITTSAGVLSERGNGDGYYSARLTSSTRDEIAVVTARYKGEPFGPQLLV